MSRELSAEKARLQAEALRLAQEGHDMPYIMGAMNLGRSAVWHLLDDQGYTLTKKGLCRKGEAPAVSPIAEAVRQAVEAPRSVAPSNAVYPAPEAPAAAAVEAVPYCLNLMAAMLGCQDKVALVAAFNDRRLDGALAMMNASDRGSAYRYLGAEDPAVTAARRQAVEAAVAVIRRDGGAFGYWVNEVHPIAVRPELEAVEQPAPFALNLRQSFSWGDVKPDAAPAAEAAPVPAAPAPAAPAPAKRHNK